ncbi:MAG: thiamine pyrophosphate-dependent dehydrogenase E1 component subunit alpha [Deltaproteobacteria bacterium]|nr:thiamine pyrophosphate-dependent dehydrogenase E1 component subunit alpha [Deltaproteobacteria bacterium]
MSVLGELDVPFQRIETTAEPELLLRMYRELLRIRVLDARMVVLQRQGRVGFYGACTGQEAVPIACGFAVQQQDWVFPALREQAIMLVRGFPLRSYIAQTFGNSGDVLKGRQMPSHGSGRAVHQVSWSSVIGPQIPQAVGAAWAAKLRKSNEVVLGFMGDGATSEPDFHAAMTFAGVHQTPSVLICQNNGWSISIPTARQTASATIAVKGYAYGVRPLRVDGNDVLAVYETVRAAVERARGGEGPTFIECVTYRIGAHSTSDDPTRYRSSEEVERWQRRDPIERFHRWLVAKGLASDALRAEIEAEHDAEAIAAIKDVEPLPPPPRESLFDDVYAELPWHLREQKEQLLAIPPAPSHDAGKGGH